MYLWLLVVYIHLKTFILGKASCDQCPSGYYCVENTTDAYSFPCPVGYYCPAGTQYSTEYPCLAGTYNPLTTQQSVSSCLLCTPGMYCENQGNSQPTANCSDGWFCTGGASQAQPIVLGKLKYFLLVTFKKNWKGFIYTYFWVF